MPSPKSGTAGNAVSPASPDTAQDADDGKPGDVTDAQANPIQTQGSQSSSSSSSSAGSSSSSSSSSSADSTPYKPDPDKKGWIEIVMVDEDSNPVPGQHYQITLPDGQTVADGTLDDKGFARVDGIDSGSCQVTFPDLDQEAWEKT